MADLSPLSPLEGAITSLVDVLRRQRVPAILIGGVAASLLGRPRAPLPTPEDLVIMKAIASRPRDIADIEAIVDVHPDLDRRRVRAQVEDFAAALDAPELVTSLDRVLERTPVPKTSRTAPRARGTPRERPPRPRRAKASPRTPRKPR